MACDWLSHPPNSAVPRKEGEDVEQEADDPAHDAQGEPGHPYHEQKDGQTNYEGYDNEDEVFIPG